MNQTPLCDALRRFAEQRPLRMHMPGHKGHFLPLPELSPAAALDVTELPPTGNLFESGGPIEAAEDLWARAFGSTHCLFLTGGSTQGVLSAFTLACRPGDQVLVDRGCHRSAFNAMALLDLHPHYLFRPWLREGEVTGPISPRDLEEALEANPAVRAGGIDFATTEAKVVLDAEGRPTDIALRRKTDATRLVEEAMILANETVAGYLERRGFPCLYRVHEPPASDALGSLIPVFQEFDWFERPMEARLVAGDPKVIQEILAASAPRSEGELVSSLLLRAMKRADYRPENQGHYGLASEAYCHFTSPIRRYPDLVVHRMLRAALARRPEKFDQEVAALPWIAEHSSAMERVAEAAARESQELKMVEYLAAFAGQSFSAVISGVAAWGLYVRLDCTAEGILPVRALGDEYFVFDPVRYTLVGDESGKVYRLGQRVAVTLKSADATTASLEFVLAGSR